MEAQQPGREIWRDSHRAKERVYGFKFLGQYLTLEIVGLEMAEQMRNT